MKYVFIINPISGNKDIVSLKEEIKKRMEGYSYEIWESEHPLHCISLAKKAVEYNIETIIVAGGDGSIIEVITGILGTKVKLGIIPYGTGNMLASNLEIPLNSSKALDLILKGYSQKIDIGKINDKHFAFMAGCGFDAKIIDETSREKKKKLGLLAYFIEGFRQVFSIDQASFKIKLDNKKVIRTKALTVIIANSGNIIGNVFSLAPQASSNDGLLDLIVIAPKTHPDYFKVLWQILVKATFHKDCQIKYYQAKTIEIKSKPSLLVQADGDIIGKTPIKITVLPKAIDIIMPQQIPAAKISYKLEDIHIIKAINLAIGKLR